MVCGEARPHQNEGGSLHLSFAPEVIRCSTYCSLGHNQERPAFAEFLVFGIAAEKRVV